MRRAACYTERFGEAPSRDSEKLSDSGSSSNNQLSNIEELLNIDKEDAPETFVNSIPIIFRYAMK